MIGVDINQTIINTINQGKIHIVEPDLDSLVHKMVTNGHLRAVNLPQESDAFLITVPTPFKNNHEPDISYVEKAAQSIAPVIKKGDLIVLESTSPVGTSLHIAKLLAKMRPDLASHIKAKELLTLPLPIVLLERVMPGASSSRIN